MLLLSTNISKKSENCVLARPLQSIKIIHNFDCLPSLIGGFFFVKKLYIQKKDR